jgi:hypothetical protein
MTLNIINQRPPSKLAFTQFKISQNVRWIAYYYAIGRHVTSNYCTRAYNGVIANCNSWENNGSSADPNIISYGNRFFNPLNFPAASVFHQMRNTGN